MLKCRERFSLRISNCAAKERQEDIDSNSDSNETLERQKPKPVACVKPQEQCSQEVAEIDLS